MNIIEIKNYFFLKRKDFILQLFNIKDNNNNGKIIYLNDELNSNKFIIIRKYIKIFDIKETKKRKEKLIESFKKDLIDNSILDFYIEIIKLLTIDNTNEKLLEIYLLFLNLYEKEIIKKFEDSNIEKFKDEVLFYSVCFSKNDYKELFNIDKKVKKKNYSIF